MFSFSIKYRRILVFSDGVHRLHLTDCLRLDHKLASLSPLTPKLDVPHFLREHSSSSLFVGIFLPPYALYISLIKSSEILDIILFLDNNEIDIAARPHVVKDSCPDGISHQLLGILLTHVRDPPGLQHGHGREGAGAHSAVWNLTGGAMSCYFVKMWSSYVNPTHDEIGPDVSLVPEQHLLDQPVGSHDPDLPASVESVELQLAGDGGCGLVTISCSSSTSTINIGGHVVKLLTILVCHDISTSGPGICSKDDPILEDDSTDSGSCLGHFGRRVSFLSEESIPLAVFKIESLRRRI